MQDKGILSLGAHVKLMLDENASNEPYDKSESPDYESEYPPWFNLEKFQRGQKYLRDNIYAHYNIMLTGLICVLAVPSILVILVKTQKSSTVVSAYRRYLSTIDHVHSWFEEDLQPGSKSWRSLLTVRNRHLRASRYAQKKGFGYISQRDLTLTQFGFFGFGVIEPKMTGLHFTSDEDIEGYIHFWRTIGYMIGIEDRYNLCRPSTEETVKICKVISSDIYRPYMLNPPEYFFYMVSVLTEAMSYINPFISEGAFLYYIYRLLRIEGFNYTDEEKRNAKTQELEGQNNNRVECEKVKIQNGIRENGYNSIVVKKQLGEEFFEQLGWYNRTILGLMVRTFERSLTTEFARTYYQYQIVVTRFLVKYFPFLCFWRFGFKYSYVDMFAEDVSVAAKLKTNKEMLASRQY